MKDEWCGVPDFPAAELATIDARTRDIGQFVFSHLDDERPHLFQRRWWDEQLMNLAMRDESLKIQLFRFVDVLPMLDSPDAVVEHLQQYLGGVRGQLPLALRAALGIGRHTAWTRAAVTRLVRLSALDLARRFIAGTNVREVVESAHRERQLGRAFTLDILGEAVTSHREAEQFFRAYVELIERVSPEVNAWPEQALVDQGPTGTLPRMNLSIKLSALDARFDALDQEGSLQRAGARLRELLRCARRHGAFINVDMESYAKKDLTLAIFQQVLGEPEFRDFEDVGLVIQCYLRDAPRDLQALAAWAQRRGTPVWVRLVKGAYWDYETILAMAEGWPIPVYQQKWQSDASFERAVRFVIRQQGSLRPALGTHNIRSLAHGLAVAEHVGLPPNAVELQMLYGMADAEKRVLVSRGQRLRVYMPYGELLPGMAYLVRRLLENTSNNSFLRAGFVERVAWEQLLENPAQRTNVPFDEEKTHPMNAAESATQRPAIFRNEPPVDFAVESNRQLMQAALHHVLGRLGRHYPLVIGGERFVTDRQFVSSDPSLRARVVGTVGAADTTHVDQAVAAAQEAWPAWRARSADERAAFLRRMAQHLRDRLFETAAWEVYECGKGWREATNDVCEAIDFLEYYAGGAVELERPQGLKLAGEENQFEYLSRGVTAVIAPWNFPLAILTGMTAAALATGNPVVMKPAGQSSVIGALLMQLAEEAELPPGVLNYLPGNGSVVGPALVDDPRVAMIAFTGSQTVGLEINSRAAAASARGIGFVKKVIAEMGGKNAILVDDDADLDEAVLGVMKSAFGYQGQKCSACSRVIVLAGVYDAFLSRLVEATRSLTVGPAESPASDVGPVIDDAALAKIHEYIAVGRQEGRELLAVDVGSLAEQGCFVGPHIFVDVPPAGRLAQEEIFGPVLAVFRADAFSEALELANGTPYALTGGVFSRSPAHVARAKRELQVGNLYINRPITGALVGRQPFGGFKMSGIGSKAGGPDYLLQFVLPRTITENTMRRGFAPPS